MSFETIEIKMAAVSAKQSMNQIYNYIDEMSV